MANTDKFKSSVNNVISNIDDAITDLENIETFYNTDSISVPRTDNQITMDKLLKNPTRTHDTATQRIENAIETIRAAIIILKHVSETATKE